MGADAVKHHRDAVLLRQIELSFQYFHLSCDGGTVHTIKPHLAQRDAFPRAKCFIELFRNRSTRFRRCMPGVATDTAPAREARMLRQLPEFHTEHGHRLAWRGVPVRMHIDIRGEFTHHVPHQYSP